MSPKSSSTKETPSRFPTPNKAKQLLSPEGPLDPRNSESSMSSMNNFNNAPSSLRLRTLEEIREDPEFKKSQSEFREAVRKALAPRTSRTRQYKNPKVKRKLLFNVPEEESKLIISGPASKVSVSNIAKQANAKTKTNAKAKAKASANAKEARVRARVSNQFKRDASRRQSKNQIQEYRNRMLEANTGSKAGTIKSNKAKQKEIKAVQKKVNTLTSRANTLTSHANKFFC